MTFLREYLRLIKLRCLLGHRGEWQCKRCGRLLRIITTTDPQMLEKARQLLREEPYDIVPWNVKAFCHTYDSGQ